MKKFKELREHSLEEKLKASDPAGTYIHDFVHSDNPKFAGKSKAKRIQMALAASYAAKGKSRNEEVEQIDEISTKTLASAAHAASDPDSDYYYGKSHDPQKFAAHAKKTKDAKSATAVQGAADAKGHYPRAGHTYGSDKLAQRQPPRVTISGKANKQDIKSLKSSLQKEEVESVEEAANAAQQAAIAINMKKQGKKPKHMGEDVEQIDELKKTTIKSYINKKTDQMYNKAGERMPSMNRIRKDMDSMQKAHARNTGAKPTSESIMTAVKNLAKKASKTLTGGSDEDQRKDLQRKMGVPQTGKKPMQK